jgi:hypothetical protein
VVPKEDLPYKETFYRVGDRVLLVATCGSSFDFEGARLIVGEARGTVVQLPDHVGVSESVIVHFDKWPGTDIAIAKSRLSLDNPLDRLERET